MKETSAIACTLTDSELRDRTSAWMKVGRYATSAAPIGGGLLFGFAPAPGVEPSLRQLIELEAECCEWMTIRLDRLQDGLQMSVIGIGDDGEQAARETFAPLAELVSGRPSAAQP